MPIEIENAVRELTNYHQKLIVIGTNRSGKSTFINKSIQQNVINTQMHLNVPCRWNVTISKDFDQLSLEKVFSTVQQSEGDQPKAVEFRSEQIYFKNLMELQSYIIAELQEKKIKEQTPKDYTFDEVLIRLPGVYENCKEFSFVELPKLEDSEKFNIEDIVMYIQNQGKINPVIFINLDEESDISQFETLWEVLNETEQVVPIVLTRVMDLDNKIRLELGKNKKQVVTDQAVLERINLFIKEIIMQIADKLQKFEIFVFDEPNTMFGRESIYWFNQDSHYLTLSQESTYLQYKTTDGFSVVSMSIREKIKEA